MLLSAFEVLLLRYTSQEDLVIGCTLVDSPSEHSASRRNAFLLRAHLFGDPSFRDVVSRTGADALEVTPQGSVCLSELTEELTSSLGVQAPTFQVSFSYGSGKSQAARAAAASPAKARVHRGQNKAPRRNMTMMASRRNATVSLRPARTRSSRC